MDNQLNNQEAVNQTPINTFTDLNITPPKNSKNNLLKIIFIFLLTVFILVATAFAYFTIQNNQKKSAAKKTTSINSCFYNNTTYQIGDSFTATDGCNTCTCESKSNINCTNNSCVKTSSDTNSTISSSQDETEFQKLITSWGLYQEITDVERNLAFFSADNYWPGQVDSTSENYAFAQKIIKGSVKKLTIDKNNFSSILGGEIFLFYITPNYENWSNEKFTSNLERLDNIKGFFPVYAYADKLIWFTYPDCGSTPAVTTEGKKAQDQCNSLTQEVSGAFL